MTFKLKLINLNNANSYESKLIVSKNCFILLLEHQWPNHIQRQLKYHHYSAPRQARSRLREVQYHNPEQRLQFNYVIN